MTESAILWLFGTLITILLFALGGLFAWMLSHTKHCSVWHVQASREFGSISTKLDRVILDIGDHDTGLRGQVHDLANRISPYLIKEQARRKE